MKDLETDLFSIIQENRKNDENSSALCSYNQFQ